MIIYSIFYTMTHTFCSLRHTSWIKLFTRCNYFVCWFRHECFRKNRIRVNIYHNSEEYFAYLCFRFLADYVGHVNIIIIYSIISGLANLVIWSYANTFGTLMAFSIIFGFFGGAFITLSKN